MNLTQYIKSAPDPVDPALQGVEQQASIAIGKWWLGVKSAYSQYHSWIWRSLLNYAGELYIREDMARSNVLVPVRPADDWIPQPKINEFAPAIDAIASNFQNIPEIEAVPCPVDDMDRMEVADFANVLKDHIAKFCGLRSDFKTEEDLVLLAGQWFALAGCFGTKVYVEDVPMGEQPVQAEMQAYGAQCQTCDTYDVNEEPVTACPQCGNPVVPQETSIMAPQFNEDGTPMMEPLTEARLKIEIVEPLAFYPSPGAKSNTDAYFLMFASRMALNAIWSKFGIEAQPDSEYPDGWNQGYENALKFFYQGFSSTQELGKDFAMVLEVFVRPGVNKDFPEGFYAVYVNGEVKSFKPWDEARFVDFPVTKADSKPMPTLYFSRSVAFDLTGVQDLMCKFNSLITLHAMTNAVEPVVTEAGTLKTAITGRGDRVIQFERQNQYTTPPFRLAHENLSQGVFEFLRNLQVKMDQISQASQAFRGNQPGSVKAGVAIETLRAQSETMFGGPIQAWNATWAETFRKGVKTIQKHYSREQIAAIVGIERISVIDKFLQADLDECLEWVATKFGTPRTRAEKRQEMLDLFDRGLLNIEDPEVKARMFQLFGETGMTSGFSDDARRARLEESLMEKGSPPLFMPESDDNAIHLAIHGSALKSAKFLMLPPAVQDAKRIHYAETKKFMIQEAAALAQAQQPAKPAPSKSEKPGQPDKETPQ